MNVCIIIKQNFLLNAQKNPISINRPPTSQKDQEDNQNQVRPQQRTDEPRETRCSRITILSKTSHDLPRFRQELERGRNTN